MNQYAIDQQNQAAAGIVRMNRLNADQYWADIISGVWQRFGGHRILITGDETLRPGMTARLILGYRYYAPDIPIVVLLENEAFAASLRQRLKREPGFVWLGSDQEEYDYGSGLGKSLMTDAIVGMFGDQEDKDVRSYVSAFVAAVASAGSCSLVYARDLLRQSEADNGASMAQRLRSSPFEQGILEKMAGSAIYRAVYTKLMTTDLPGMAVCRATGLNMWTIAARMDRPILLCALRPHQVLARNSLLAAELNALCNANMPFFLLTDFRLKDDRQDGVMRQAIERCCTHTPADVCITSSDVLAQFGDKAPVPACNTTCLLPAGISPEHLEKLTKTFGTYDKLSMTRGRNEAAIRLPFSFFKNSSESRNRADKLDPDALGGIEAVLQCDRRIFLVRHLLLN